ncbi:MAG TPA: response regulator [Polyangiaceae bacterium]|nr:response regulator [Polyangiaceae bacterium]
MTRLLIVDDDELQARALARAFSRLRPDLTLLTASSGAEATRLMQEPGIDLVLTDLQMPEMDGFQLVAWILGNFPDVTVFTMSAFGTEQTASRLDGLGGIEYFTKPLDAKLALARLTDALDQSVRGHVQNVSLASFLQLMEMERKTCNLSIRSDDKVGVLVVRKGVLIDARSGDLSGEEAAISIIAWPNSSIMISRHGESGPAVIQKSLGFIVMEAMRVQDEAARNAAPSNDGNASIFPGTRRSWRPNVTLPESSLPPAYPSLLPATRDLGLPSGASALVIVETATGTVLHFAAKEGCPVAELARSAALVVRHQVNTLRRCDENEGIEELVLSTSSYCDVIRPIGGGLAQFALLVFAPDETNLVMARLELERFISGRRHP